MTNNYLHFLSLVKNYPSEIDFPVKTNGAATHSLNIIPSNSIVQAESASSKYNKHLFLGLLLLGLGVYLFYQYVQSQQEKVMIKPDQVD